MKMTSLNLAIANILTFTSVGAYAALPSNAILNFTPSANSTSQPPAGSGSWFSMAVSANSTLYTGIKSLNGVVLGTAQAATGSHSGLPDCTPNSACTNTGEFPNIDDPWGFFNNTGMHQTTSAANVLSASGNTANLDFSGWSVTWNGIADIPMGSGVWGNSNVFSTGVGNVVCAVDCSGGDSYVLDYHGTVPNGDPSGFGGVRYGLHLEGIIGVPGTPPLAVNDPGNKTIVGNPLTIDVLANDIANGSFILDSVAVVTNAANGTPTPNVNGTVTYAPNTGPNFIGTDTFGYTVNNASGTSNEATVTVNVQNNVAPVANNDSIATNTAALDNAGGKAIVNVLANDTDVNNTQGLPGGIDPATVTVLSQPAIGTCTKNPDGTITYTQTVPSQNVTGSCTYQVKDIDGFGTPLTSNIASVNINIASIASDWPPVLDPNVIPVLFFEAGIPGNPSDQSVPPKGGSYFTMQVTPTTLIYTTMTPGPAGGVVIGHNQPATGSHTGAPTGNEQTGLDAAWSFFSNTGFHLTRNDGVTGNPDGTLEFLTKWYVGWNGISAINLGGSSAFPQDLGFALITCTPAPCANQSAFELNFAAHVQDLPGEPSGFNGVPYTLFLKGVVGFLDDTMKTSNGTLTVADRLTVDQVPPDSGVDQQCVGDCFDFTISNVTNPSVSVVIPLAGGAPLNPVWRLFDGDWRSFDTSQGDTIESAPILPGDTQCPDPGSPNYRPLTTGDYCIQLTIKDNGPNDTDDAVGTITDPSGMGGGGASGGGEVFADNRTTNSSGCTVTNSINPSNRGDWWLLAGFIAWLGWNRRNRRQH